MAFPSVRYLPSRPNLLSCCSCRCAFTPATWQVTNLRRPSIPTLLSARWFSARSPRRQHPDHSAKFHSDRDTNSLGFSAQHLNSEAKSEPQPLDPSQPASNAASSSSSTSPSPSPRARDKQPKRDSKRPPIPKEEWQVQKAALTAKFGGTAWAPRKRLSPDAMDCIRALQDQFPNQMNTEVLAREFEVSPEAIRRILRRRWEPSADQEADRRDRWRRRGERIWTSWAQQGYKVPQSFRQTVMENLAETGPATGESVESKSAIVWSKKRGENGEKKRWRDRPKADSEGGLKEA